MSANFSFFPSKPIPERCHTPENREKAYLELYGNLQQIYQRSFHDNFNVSAISDYATGKTLSYGDFAKRVAAIHLFYEKAGVKPQDHIAVVGKNSLQWVEVFMATLLYGAVVVPILNDFSPSDIENLINHSDATGLFIDGSIMEKLDREKLPGLNFILSLDDFSIMYEKEGYGPIPSENNAGDLEYADLRSFGAHIDSEMDARYPYGFRRHDIVYPSRDPGSVALINYTSGTTGFSKGVMLTYHNLWGNVTFGLHANLHYRGSRVLSFLPLAHAYGCAFDMLLPLAAGTHITLLGSIPSPTILLKALAEVKPSLVLCVPMILEKIYRRLIVPMISKPPVSWVLAVPMLDKAVYGRIRSKLVEAFGGMFEEVIVGGAPLNPEVEDFLNRIHFPYTVGYGMTECGPLISYAPWRTHVPGSSGRALKGLMKVKTQKAEDLDAEHAAHEGEILVKGVNVMKGYYKNPEATAEVFTEDGWLRTGDMGVLAPPDDRTVFIRGRYKSMLLRANGQNIYPEEIEAKLNNMPYVGESIVLDRDGHLFALIYPDKEAMETDGVNAEELTGYMDSNIENLNSIIGQYEKVRGYELVNNEFEKTPKRSIKRFKYS